MHQSCDDAKRLERRALVDFFSVNALRSTTPATVTRNNLWEGENMGEQHSQKQGLKSSAQKEDRARDAYAELPASNEVAGAHGKNRRTTPTDDELSLEMATKTAAGDQPKRETGQKKR
jgi:hypothetical protein